MKKKMTILLIIGIIVAIVYIVLFSNVFKVSQYEYESKYGLDDDTIIKFTESYMKNYFLINIENCEEKLLNHPYVDNVVITKKMPNKLQLEIQYRDPKIYLKNGNIILALDNDLIVLETFDYPQQGFLVEGFDFQSFVVGEEVDVNNKYILKNILSLIELIEKSNLSVNNKITYEERHIKMSIGKVTVDFGTGNQIERKFNNFVDIYQAISKEDVNRGKIDVSSNGFPVYIPFGSSYD